MHILSSFLFAISANIDSLVVGLSYGTKKIKIGLASNFVIAFISVAGTILSMLVGKTIINFIPENVSNSLGSIILILIGVWTLLKTLLKNMYSNSILDNPEKVDVDNSSSISVKESIILALALTINNIGLGIAASVTGLNILITSLFTFAFSLLMIIIGYVFGSRYVSKAFGKRAIIVSGLLMVILGIYEMII